MRLWCRCGKRNLWCDSAQSECTSNHLMDPYSFAHFGHGLLMAWALMFLWRADFWILFAIAFLVETFWERYENSERCIQRYRSAGQNYGGDSLINSLADIAICMLGFLFGWWVGQWQALGVLVMVEIMLGLWIRDNNVLNVLMLSHPFERIKRWQLENRTGR